MGRHYENDMRVYGADSNIWIDVIFWNFPSEIRFKYFPRFVEPFSFRFLWSPLFISTPASVRFWITMATSERHEKYLMKEYNIQRDSSLRCSDQKLRWT